MKLNKKGLKRLLDVAFDGDEFYQSNALQIEFEPDDFVGGCCQNGKDHFVCLTVEEARAIKVRLSDLMLVAGSDRYRKVVQRSLDAIISSLNQIEQAEGKLCLTQKTI